MDRRTYCTAVGSASLVSLAGCVGSVDGHVRPDGEPDTVPTEFVCEVDGFEPHFEGYSEDTLHWGDTEDFSLRVNDLAFEYGDTAEIQLSRGTTGNRHKWNLEVDTENGWQEVRGTTAEFLDYTAEDTDGGHEWTLELTESGIVDSSFHDDSLQVCPDLVSGRYRFVYWGLIGDDSVAVAFDLAV